ncbi:transposase [Corynebacterium phocae]|uniref:Transposase n=1 Tax=Corynebacterium phocae TaxID=161895 RepID=A0A1L7D1B3_9CORY|nr:transposase [Corynebacterium phocae]APT91867.1 transposase [Corynebacterium phocae]KAA8727413.1 transposase [Corynebacterium phocae]
MGKFKKHTPEQIAERLEKASKLSEAGKTNAEICRELQISEATLSRWRREYGEMSRAAARELTALRKENDRLKRLLAGAELEKAAYKDLAKAKF